MKKNIIIIPPCFTYGDCLSIIGILYFLLEFYEKVYLYAGKFYYHNCDVSIFDYCNNLLENNKFFNKRIFVTPDPECLINESQFGEYHICNTYTGDWSKTNYLFYENKNIDKEYYFNDLNPLYNKLNISKNFIFFPNLHLPNKYIEQNHLFYYKLLGLNNKVRMDYFHYERDLENEKNVKKNILKKFSINENQKYNIINDPINTAYDFITNQYPIINIHFLSKKIGDLIFLLEGAETIHFIENSNVSFFYHCQYKNIFKYEKTIYFHIWLRNRNWIIENMNLDYAWKIMNNPRLENWRFIFNKNQITNE